MSPPQKPGERRGGVSEGAAWLGVTQKAPRRGGTAVATVSPQPAHRLAVQAATSASCALGSVTSCGRAARLKSSYAKTGSWLLGLLEQAGPQELGCGCLSESLEGDRLSRSLPLAFPRSPRLLCHQHHAGVQHRISPALTAGNDLPAVMLWGGEDASYW